MQAYEYYMVGAFKFYSAGLSHCQLIFLESCDTECVPIFCFVLGGRAYKEHLGNAFINVNMAIQGIKSLGNMLIIANMANTLYSE